MPAVAWTIFAVGTVVAVVAAVRDRAAFRKRFPPISDAEFVARCSPNTRPAVALTVRRITADALGVEYERIHPSSRWTEDLGGG